jgi:hypothetical protein
LKHFQGNLISWEQQLAQNATRTGYTSSLISSFDTSWDDIANSTIRFQEKLAGGSWLDTSFFSTKPRPVGTSTPSTRDAALLEFFRQNYAYVPPSPRVDSDKHPNCTQYPSGDWEFFGLDLNHRSRANEDRAIYEWFFKDNITKGSYLELGAFDGITESNTRFFDECLEWTGIVIEANPKMKQKVLDSRPHAHRLFFAPTCPYSNETITFVASAWSTSRNTWEGETNETDRRVVEVNCGPLSPVVETLMNGHIHFFSLDVENVEAQVLKTLDFEKVKIDVMISESVNNYCPVDGPCKGRQDVRDIMKQAGYRLYIDGIFNSDLFVHPSITRTPPKRYKEGYSERTQKYNALSWPRPRKQKVTDSPSVTSVDATARLQYFKRRYGYIRPSPRSSKKHPNCTKGGNGAWEWFHLDLNERSRALEDYTIYEWFFKNFRRKGTYVELGAYNGKAESNSRFFDECLGWTGLLIEGNPRMRHRIIKNRPHAHKMFFAPSCLHEGENDTIKFHAMPFANVGQEGVAKDYIGRQGVDVPCGPLSPVLETVFKGHVNFFSLDVEGAEALVLRTVDWSKVKVDVLIAESINTHCLGKRCKSRQEVRDIMHKAGYKLYIDGVYLSDLFVHPSVALTPPAEFKEGYEENRRQKTRFRADPPLPTP